MVPAVASYSSLSGSLSPGGGSSPRSPSLHSFERVSAPRGMRSFSTLSSAVDQGGSSNQSVSLCTKQLTRAYARQESVSRVLAFARDGLQTAVRESAEIKRQEIVRQVHAQLLYEQLQHQGSVASLWSSSQDDVAGPTAGLHSNCLHPSVSSLPQFTFAPSHNADFRSTSALPRSVSNATRVSPRAHPPAKRTTSEPHKITDIRHTRTTLTGIYACIYIYIYVYLL